MDEDLKTFLSLIHLMVMYGFMIPGTSYWYSAYKSCNPENRWLMYTGFWLIAFSSFEGEGLKAIKKTWILMALLIVFMSLRWRFL